MKIRDAFLPLARPDITNDELDAISEVVQSGWWTTGPKVFEFEKEFARYLEHERPLFCVGLNSCTSALFLALKALGVGEGDEVILPTWTFAATIQVVEWLKAKPVLCDIEEKTMNIDLGMAEQLVTQRTKAIIPVHIAGYPCHMEQLTDLATVHKIKVVEDAAHAIGTKYKNVKIGNFSDATCFSFYATKNLAMGEGGAVVSRDESLIDCVSKLAYFGINKEAFKRYEKAGKWFYDIEGLGYKCNLDSLHATLGLVQLKKIDRLNQRRRQIADHYRHGLGPKFKFPPDSLEHYHTYHLFPVVLDESLDRDSFALALMERNIGTSVHFIPLHQHSFYKNRYKSEQFPTANKLFRKIISIPLFPSMTDEDTQYVIDHMNQIAGG